MLRRSSRDAEDDGRECATEIVYRVARAKGADPLDLAPLQNDVDTDALNSLCAHPGENVEVSFEYEGFRVTVSGDGRVRLQE